MARLGIDYTGVKQAALKLLNQGTAPSVQKIREVLGTGSNTTIAGHLKTWRDEYAQQAIHHLPAHLPTELIASMDVLWQTALAQAEKQLLAFKNELDAQHEKIQQEKAFSEKTILDLKSKLLELEEQLAQKIQEHQAGQIELALAHERHAQLQETLTQHEATFESRLKRVEHEKHEAIEKTQIMQRDLEQLRQELAQQTKQLQEKLTEQRLLQEESEKRWLNLIDQARTELKDQRKRYESALEKQAQKMETLQTGILHYQSQYVTQQATVTHQDTTITDLKEQLNQLQTRYNEAVVSTLKTKTVQSKTINKRSKKDVECT